MNKPIVTLVDEDRNAFVIIGKVRTTLRRVRYSQEDIEQYTKDATSGNYDNLLTITMKWVEVE